LIDSLRRNDDSAALFTLVDTIEKLSGVQTVEDVAAVVRSSARSISNADGVAVVLRDGDKCHYLDEDAIGPLWKGRRFPMTACISGWAMMNRRSAVISDIYLDDRIPHDAYRPTFVKSLVMTPVRPADPLAAIGAYWREVRSWEPEELMRLELMARATATALENARLYASLTEALERRDLLIREMDHRVKNTLATVQAIAFQTFRGAESREAFITALNGRLQALSRAHELLVRGGWGRADLGELAREALTPFAPPGEERLTVAGPEVRLAPEVAVSMQMIIHELAVNAARHGAWSGEQGRVHLAWTAEPQSGLRLTWVERGGPAVVEPERRGFGSRLIERALAQDLSGIASLQFDPEGIRYEMAAPLDRRISLP
jgi:two-component sensor histidine kinase